MLRILLTGGGSSGHIYPLVAVAEELQKQAVQTGAVLDMQFIGDDGFAEDVVATIGIKFKKILSPKWRRYASADNLIDVFKAPLGFIQSLFYLWLYMPDLVFSKGGYDSFLPSLATRIFMIPVVIHESDVVPGKTNLWVGKWAKKIFVAFDGARAYFKNEKTELAGNPLRSGVLNLVGREQALSAFSLDSAKPTVLITGASQGANIINQTLLLSLAELAKKFQVIHQCGPKNYDQVNLQVLSIVEEGKNTYGKLIAENYRLYPVFDLQQMAWAYSAADIVVSRAGAGTIFEVAAVGKPSILIPLKGSAGDHQLANAREFAKFGAIVIEEDNLTPHILINEIENVYENRVALATKIKEFARPNAAQIIAEQLLAAT